MIVTLLRGLEGLHLVGWTLETHADAATCALDLKATCVADHQCLATRAYAFSNSFAFDVVFHELILRHFGLLAVTSRMVVTLNSHNVYLAFEAVAIFTYIAPNILGPNSTQSYIP